MAHTNPQIDKKILYLFHPVVIENSNKEHVGFFIDQTRSIAFGGFRRSWGLGDLFVRYRGPIAPFDWSENYGIYSYEDNTFTTSQKLPGKKLPTGGYEQIGEEDCNNMFETAFQQVAGHHQLVLNPRQVLEWIHQRTLRVGINDRVINIQGFDSVNTNSGGQFAAKVEDFEGERVVSFRTPQGLIPLYIHEADSLIHTNFLRKGDWVVAQTHSIVGNRRYVKIVRMHQPGINVAIQYFKAGTLMPGDARYSIHPGEDGNSINEADTHIFPFIEGQDKPNLKTAPMLTIQLDTLQRAMEALSGYKRVELLYKNSHTPFVVTPFVKEGEAIVDVVCSAFSQYKSGKVVTT